MISKEIRDRLSAPIPADEILWKPQTFSGDKTRALMVAYVDARWVAERLDEAADGDWEFVYEDLGVHGDSEVIKGSLTVCGTLRQDVGEYKFREKDDMEGYKAAVSDALKRCSVLFGVGRELYRMDAEWLAWDQQKRQPAEGVMDALRKKIGGAQTPWTSYTADVERFYKWAADQTLTNAQALEALGAEKISEYTKSKEQAMADVKAYIAKKAK